MSKEFKVGDKVYCPFQSTKVLTTREWNNPEFPILVGEHVFTRNGKRLRNDSLPSIFHATPRMQAKLEDTYGVAFEAPPTKPTSKEIISTLLDNGHKYVCCWVSDNNPNPDNDSSVSMINRVNYSTFSLITEYQKVHWKYATPFDPCTNEAITELPK